MAEECAERGYAETSVAELARRAGVSPASFYRQFKDRRECMLTSFAELFGRLLEAIERACADEEDAAEKPRAGIRTAAGLLAADSPTVRLLTIEIAAAGVEGVRLQQAAIERLAALLRGREGRPRPLPHPSPLPSGSRLPPWSPWWPGESPRARARPSRSWKPSTTRSDRLDSSG